MLKDKSTEAAPGVATGAPALQWGLLRDRPNPIGDLLVETSRVISQVVELKNKELINSAEKNMKRTF